MSDDDNLTTDAVPGAPRKIPIKCKVNIPDSKNNEDTKAEIGKENISKVEPTCNKDKNKSKESKPNKSKSNNAALTNVFVYNSHKVHVGSVNNFNYGSENKNKRSEDPIPRTDEINRVLDSKIIVSREHIELIATHLGLAWRDIGLELGYSSGQLDNFYEDNKTLGQKEVVYQMILDWTQEKADDAILGYIATTLWNQGQKYVVQKLSSLL